MHAGEPSPELAAAAAEGAQDIVWTTFLMILSGMLSLSNLTRESMKPLASANSCFFAGSQKSSTFVAQGQRQNVCAFGPLAAIGVPRIAASYAVAVCSATSQFYVPGSSRKFKLVTTILTTTWSSAGLWVRSQEIKPDRMGLRWTLYFARSRLAWAAKGAKVGAPSFRCPGL